MKCRFLIDGLLLACSIVVIAAAAPATKPSTQPAEHDQAELEKAFAEALSGATLVGHATTGDEGKDAAPQPDRYTISKVSKLAGDQWLFVARVEFGGKDVSVPIPLDVKWAGDTPVITLDDLAIPGLGTYTARVMIFREQYAGTWSGGGHGGHLWGRIERAGAAGDDDEEKPAEQ